jgi:hypothetical protein
LSSLAIAIARFGRFDDIAEKLDLDRTTLRGRLSNDEIELFNTGVAEMSLAKAAPRVGRSCRTPPELGDILQRLGSVLSGPRILPPAAQAEFLMLSVALSQVGDAPLEKAKEVQTNLNALNPENVADSSLLHPVIQLTSFKELQKLCLKDVALRINDLTKTRTLADLSKLLQHVEDDQSRPLMSSGIREAWAAAAAYVATLPMPHEDINKFIQIIDRFLTVASSFCSTLDWLQS